MNEVNNDEDINSSFDDEFLAEIVGRYPELGYHKDSYDKIIYILNGSGKLYFENKRIKYVKGDALFIEKGENYYFKTDYSLVCVSYVKLNEKIKKLIK